MSLVWQPWLPAGAAAPVAAQRAVQDMVAAWSREWFADDPVRAAGPLAPAAAPRSELRKTSWHGCEEMAIGVPHTYVTTGTYVGLTEHYGLSATSLSTRIRATVTSNQRKELLT